MNTEKQEEVKVLAALLFDEFKSIALSIEETAQITRRSKVSLDRDRASGIGIPSSKLGKESGSDPARYSIYDIAKFCVERKKKVMS